MFSVKLYIKATVASLKFILISLIVMSESAQLSGLAVNAAPATEFRVIGVVGGGAVVNASTPLVVMDCHYNIPQGQEAGLVVKWFKDDNPRPVYQWILGSKPQAVGILRSRLDLQYQSSPDPLKAHSALAFVSPSTEVSGDYTCRVATYQDEGQAKGSLQVYTPPNEFHMNIISRSVGGKVTIACGGFGVYPEPSLTLFRINVKTRRRSLMRGRLEKNFNSSTNLHSSAVESSILGHQLIGETVFECVLAIPGTDYRLVETIRYHPVYGRSTAAALSGDVHMAVSKTLLFIGVLLTALVVV